MVFGSAEAFTPEQLAEIYDANVRSTQRVTRAALPILGKPGGDLCGRIGSVEIASTIVVPGAFTSGTNHFANAGKPNDASRLNEYSFRPDC
jgi:NAD(P)-dependent dehydrogenase (short-subunit alcohol dehydrogenase family)